MTNVRPASGVVNIEKAVLGIVDVSADIKAKSAKTAMYFSRVNTLLSIPMLYCMVGAQNLY